MTMWPTLLLVGSVFLFVLLGLFYVQFLFSILSRAHVGYLHLVRTSLRCCCFVMSSPGVEQTGSALCVSVLMILLLPAIW